jgi:uncharacterized protein (TIGR02271 family)
MTHVVIGVFEDMGKLAMVRQELTRAGFAEGDINVKSQEGSGGSRTASASAGTGEKEEGGIAHFFRSLFGLDSDDDEHSGLYSEAVRRNNAVVTVNASDDDKADRAEEILDRCGAIDVEERSAQWRQEGWTPAAAKQSSTSMRNTATGQAQARQATTQPAGNEPMAGAGSVQGQKIPVVEEELLVAKREVRRGGVRVFSRVREVPVEESVTLREEEAKVTRRPVDRPATEQDLAAFKETSVEVRETAEEPVISKKARVIEEVEVGKQTTQREEKVRDTVRHTDVEVEQLGGADHDADFRQHWTSTYGSSGSRYDEYAPAYRYGSTLAGSGHYTGRTWEEIEPEAREDWEKQHPGSTWERFKDSIRYGWEKLTGSAQSGAGRSPSGRSGPQPGRTTA